MANENQPTKSIKQFFDDANVKNKFSELLGKKAQGFITSVLQAVASNEMLKNADPMSVYQSAAVAATLDLPINNNLGFAYIVPYNITLPDKSKKVVAQFQMGYKGFKQLALRTSQFKTIHATDVRQGEIKKQDRLTGVIEFEWNDDEDARLKLPIVGYVSYFELLSGYTQTFYMPVAKVREHAKKYSKTFDKSNSLWNNSFDDMALKTVTKLNLSKNAPLSIEMQNAIVSDQALIKDADTMDVEYVDNTPEEINKEAERLQQLIHDCKTLEELEAYRETAYSMGMMDVFVTQQENIEGGK